MEDTFVDGVTESLWDLIRRRRTSAIRISRNTALLSRHLLRMGCPPERYAECTRRRGAKDLGLSVSEFRTALDTLLLWGWIEQRPSVANTSGQYRLTRQFVEVVRSDDVALYHAIRDRLPAVFEAEEDSGEKVIEAIGDSELREALHALSYTQWMHRLFELNRLRRDRYRQAYNKGTLRNICKVLHWFLQQDARHPDVPIITSLRRLATQTGLVFETAKRARDHLVTWGALEYAVDVYRLHHQRLVGIIEGEHAELPAPTRRFHRRKSQDSSRTLVGSCEANAGECCGLLERGSA